MLFHKAKPPQLFAAAAVLFNIGYRGEILFLMTLLVLAMTYSPTS